MTVLELNKFVTEQCPGGQIIPIEQERPPKVLDRLGMLLSRRIVVSCSILNISLRIRRLPPIRSLRLTDQATNFRPVLVDLRIFVCHLTQLGLFTHDVEHVRVDLDLVQSERVDLSDLVESPFCGLEICRTHPSNISSTRPKQLVKLSAHLACDTGPTLVVPSGARWWDNSSAALRPSRACVP